jgi:purine nucleoside permease
MFDPEAEVWYGISDFDVLARNITIPGFSPLYPDAHCTADGEVASSPLERAVCNSTRLWARLANA